jgi:NADH dehydrogenase [ubiquinone] 1 alpha subcomplex assembly factor 1
VFISKAISGSFDDLMPPPEKYIFNFNSKQELNKWHLYSDSEFGGTLLFQPNFQLLLLNFVTLVNLILGFLIFYCYYYSGLSSASLQIPESENGSSTGIFSGNLSLEVTPGAKWSISRGGFCGMRSKKVGF